MPNVIDAHIGCQIRLARRTSGVSIAELAKVLDLRELDITAIEIGAKRLDPARMLKATRHLGVPVSALFQSVAKAIGREPI